MKKKNNNMINKLNNYNNNNYNDNNHNSSNINKKTKPRGEKLVKITTIVGPQADALIEASKRGCMLEYKDNSVKGLTILDIYGEASEYWSGGRGGG